MKGYKGFNKGLICRGKQYAENTVFEEDGTIICKKGMRFCVDPLEVLNYYPMLNENGEENEFAEVESLDDAVTNDGKEYVSKELKIIKKISIDELFAAGTKQIVENSEAADLNNKPLAQIASSSDYSQIASSGDSAKIGFSGNSAKIASSGNYSQIASSGYDAKIGSSGYGAQIASSGNSPKIGSSGDYSQIGSSGDYSQIASSGYGAQVGSSGNHSKIDSSGDSAKIGSSGDYSQITSIGKNAVICCAGKGCAVKGKKGTWITLAEWKYINNEYVPVCVKTKKIDGVKIKEDTFYVLKNGKFTEIEK